MDQVVDDVTRAYLAAVDARLPGRIEGLYLVGSVALDDFHPQGSDIDAISVVSDQLRPDELDALTELHAELARRRPKPIFSGVYVTWQNLANDPRQATSVPGHYAGRLTRTGGFDANPVQWLALKNHPVDVRGPAEPTVWADVDAVRDWTLQNLNSYWAGWVASRRRPTRHAAETFTDWGIAWGVLGVARQHYTLATGDVASKTNAGHHALATFEDRWRPIISEALRIRTGVGTTSLFRHRPLARRRAALDFMDHVINDANTRHGASSRTQGSN